MEKLCRRGQPGGDSRRSFIPQEGQSAWTRWVRGLRTMANRSGSPQMVRTIVDVEKAVKRDHRGLRRQRHRVGCRHHRNVHSACQEPPGGPPDDASPSALASTSSHIHPTFMADLGPPFYRLGDKTAGQCRLMSCAVVQAPCLRVPCSTTTSSRRWGYVLRRTPRCYVRLPSMVSRMMSAWPACRAVSSIMCTATHRRFPAICGPAHDASRSTVLRISCEAAICSR